MSPTTKPKRTTKKVGPAPKEKPLAAVRVRKTATDADREVHALEPSQLTRAERPQLVTPAAPEAGEGRYVYGVIQTKEPLAFGKIGMGGTGETVMKAQTIIPMSFGTVFRTDDDIREVLKSIYPSLKDVLKQMANKLEFGLKVTWDRDQIIEELKRQHEDIHRFHQE